MQNRNINEMKVKNIEGKNQIDDAYYRFDYPDNSLIVYSNDILFFLSLNSEVGIKVEMQDIPVQNRNKILKNIIFNVTENKKIKRNRKRYKYNSKIEKIIQYLSTISKNAFNILENIKMFNYADKKTLDVTLRDKINYILKNHK